MNQSGRSVLRHGAKAVLALVAVVMVTTSCAAIEDLTAPSEWEPLPIKSILRAAQTTNPGKGQPPADLIVDFGWPSDVPAPSFVDQQYAGRGGDGDRRLIDLRTSDKLDEDEVAAYVSLLLQNGFVIGPDLANPQWLSRDDGHWIDFRNSPTPDLKMAQGFGVFWTNIDPASPVSDGILDTGQ